MSSHPQAKIQISIERSYGIDRAMPVILTGRISESEWITFCDQVDKIVLPLNEYRKLLYIGFIALPLSFIVSVAVSIISFGFTASSSSSMSPQPLLAIASPMLIFLLPMFIMIAVIGSLLYASHQTQKAFVDVKQVCESISNRYEMLSFHLRDDKTVVGGREYSSTNQTFQNNYRVHHDIYILVSINPANDGMMPQDVELGGGGMSYAASTTSPLEVEATKVHTTVSAPVVEAYRLSTVTPIDDQSIEGRLDKLDRIRHVITAKEYEEKRKEILAEI